ncbi:MAG: DUF4139 domain-containing protein [Phycisphaerales bacterium]|nr:DUF4139 domain-containing protein [Phycisphaerales bacterium]
MTQVKGLLLVGVVLFVTTGNRISALESRKPGATTDLVADTNILKSDDLSHLPVREITVFKDGHAFVLHEGELPTDASGNIVLGHLPAPVIGTFWSYSADPAAKLAGVVAGTQQIQNVSTALSLRELLEANTGAACSITEVDGKTYTGRILGVPVQRVREEGSKSDEQEKKKLVQKGSVILIETPEGVKAVPINRIQDVTFQDVPKRTLSEEERRNVLTLKLDWSGETPREQAHAGLAYLQRGIRWIPNYRITIDGDGTAKVKLQATLLNEMIDLEDVTAHLVIGVPSFAFKDTLSPLSLQKTVAKLSQYFQEGRQTAHAFSNSLMVQTARMGEYRNHSPSRPPPPSTDLGPDMPEGARNEDLFIFTLEHITLKKGQRMILPVAEFTLAYKDVFGLDVPIVPPMEAYQQFSTHQQRELARLFNAPKVKHKIRLVNNSDYPLTTAPAMIVQDGRVLAQSMMTYTATGATTDLEITTSVDIQVAKSDKETKRDLKAMFWNNKNYQRINFSGSIRLTNYCHEAVEIEVVRHVFGTADSASGQGQIEKANISEEGWPVAGPSYPRWWRWYSWPWWDHFNGISRIKWSVGLKPGESLDLSYAWHYYWM